MDKAMKELNEAMKTIGMGKNEGLILKRSMKEVDFDKIKIEIA